MKNRALLSAVALCFLVAGCESKKEEPVKPKVADKVVPVPAPAPTPPPASAAQDAKPVQLAANTTVEKAIAIPPGLKGCTRGNCKVTLTVTGTGDPNCKITANPDPRGVFKDNKDDFIEWTIATDGWEFDANGIDFRGNPQFTQGQPAGPKKYKVKDANTDPRPTAHNYKMNLKSTTSANKCTRDPSIVNDAEVSE